MTPALSMDAVTIGQECLQQMEALRHEIETAIDAVAQNSLPDFEHSLWQQEMLSVGLRRSLSTLAVLPVDAALLTRVRQADALLRQTARGYQRLVEQSSQSGAVLRDLCSLYQHAPVSVTSTRQQTLSCEA